MLGPWPVLQGLLPERIDRRTGQAASDRVSIGAGSDSTYEYLLKYWLLTDKQASAASFLDSCSLRRSMRPS